MIKLYSHPALPYEVVPVDIRKGEMDDDARHATVRQNAHLAS